MRHISRWAKRHPAKARCTIILLQLILAALAVFAGIGLNELGVDIPLSALAITLLLLLITGAIYPAASPFFSSSGARTYRRRKICDFLIGACAFSMLCIFADNPCVASFGSNPIFGSNPGTELSAGHKPTAEEILASLPAKGKRNLSRQEKRILKAEFKRQLINYARAKADGNDLWGAKILLILLAIVAAVGLLYLVAALACNLSCTGSGAAAVTVGILGTAAVIFLAVLAINRISRIKKHRPEARPSDGNAVTPPQ